MNKNNSNKCFECKYCGNPIRDPSAEDLGKKYFPDGDSQ